MDLSAFIRANQENIIERWERFARHNIPGADAMNSTELQDHLGELLGFIAEELKSPQVADGQAAQMKDDAVDIHCKMRFLRGFDGVHMAAEYRALRAGVVDAWQHQSLIGRDDISDLVRFNDLIDQLLMESFSRYMENLTRARSLFLGTLIHDMRSPLAAAMNCIQLLQSVGPLDERQRKLVTQVEKSTDRLGRLVSDLIDAVRVRLGKPLSVSTEYMNMGEAMEKAVAEIRAAHPGRQVLMHAEGDLKGEWDATRMGQILSNLIGNAVQHGTDAAPIKVEARGEGNQVVLSVHNEGEPIPEKAIPTLFDPLTRGVDERQIESDSTSLGLGLFITREIVTAHGGAIEVRSSKDKGTTFIVRLPRRPQRRETDERLR